ncbi:hypothetical protein ACIGW7_20260 [Streptomyces sp. NPDC053253]|uniref:hypothetical protein n=1 Tax=Streptomyces sp. NPDC053253 TaxID=3365699 RepID=UPI0037CEC327
MADRPFDVGFRVAAACLPLEPGHRYVVGAVPDPACGDGWVGAGAAADNDLTTATSRWTRAVNRQVAPHPDPACNDVINDSAATAKMPCRTVCPGHALRPRTEDH